MLFTKGKLLNIKELLRADEGRLSDLRTKIEARAASREQVRAFLPAVLAASIVSAGIDDGELTIAVTNACWASRLRYVTEMLRVEMGRSAGVEIRTVRIMVAPR